MRQLDLPLEDHEREFMGLIAGMVMRLGHKQVAFELGMSEATLSHCLNPKSRHTFHPCHILKLIQMDGGWVLVDYQASMIGRQVIDAVPPSMAEEYLALKQVVERFPEEWRMPVKRAQRKQIRDNRAARRVVEGDRKG